MKKIVIFTGAGISQESGISTFRDQNGLWENHDIHEVAHPDGWKKDRTLVNKFYNLRRQQLLQCEPNPAHYAITKLQDHFNVCVITQNVDDLHERAGNTNIVHLHGQLRTVRDEKTGDVYTWDSDLKDDDLSPNNNLLRPNIVWFDEPVPNMAKAKLICKDADYLLVIGTSLEVYPAANLLQHTNKDCKTIIFSIDEINGYSRHQHIIGKAGDTLPNYVDSLLEELNVSE